MTGRGKGSTGNCARNWNLTIRTNGKAYPRIRLTKWDAQNSLGFWDTNRQPNFVQTARPRDGQKKKKKKKKKKRKREPVE